MTNGVAAYLLTLDEAHGIADAIRSLQGVADHIVVVDSGSIDGTRELAQEQGAIVWERSFDSFSTQRNWAIDRIAAELAPQWILQLDADERLSNELATEINTTLQSTDVDVYLLPLRIKFSGRILHHGGFARSKLPRLFRTGAGRYEEREVNEHFAPTPSARLGRLEGILIHEDVASWERHIAKHNRYSTLEARARWQRRSSGESNVSLRRAIRQPFLRRRWLRENIWERLPGRPAIRFFQIFVLGAGLLDGRAGFRIALFHAWQEMCTDAKAEELERQNA